MQTIRVFLKLRGSSVCKICCNENLLKKISSLSLDLERSVDFLLSKGADPVVGSTIIRNLDFNYRDDIQCKIYSSRALKGFSFFLSIGLGRGSAYID